MKEYKLWMADIDGTIFNHETRKPGPKTIAAFAEMRKRGIKLCIASGRPLWQNVEDHYQDWGMAEQFDYLVGMNGGEIWSKETNEVKTYGMLHPEDIKRIVLKMNELDFVNPFIYYDRDVMMSQYEDGEMAASALRHQSVDLVAKDVSELWSKPTGKLLFRCHSEENAWTALQFSREHFGKEFACFRTGPALLEIQLPEVSKGSALDEICKDMGITREDVIAFGDAENDIEMLEVAGFSVCLANGMDDVKALCDDVTEYGAGEDGLGRYLFDHVLK